MWVNGDYAGAIQNANLAVESTIKAILGIDKAKPGELFHRIVQTGIVPEYYEGFLQAFEEKVLRSVAIIRNEELGAGHGQGMASNPIPKPLAELAVNLSAVVILFLMKAYVSSHRSTDLEPEEDYPW
jgi:hypothetical protein